MKIPRSLHDQILRHGESCYPEESCGFIVGAADGSIVEVVPVTNAAEKMRRERPDEFTRGARDGYVMDPQEQLTVMRDVESSGRVLRGIYHSHVDVGAYFSAEDKGRAAPFGEPLFPDATYIVADIRKEGGRSAKAFVWDDAAADFLERPLEIVEG